MALMKKEIQKAQHNEIESLNLESQMSSKYQQDEGVVSISAQLGLDMKHEVGSLFMVHQEN
jgi:hypothetical protein